MKRIWRFTFLITVAFMALACVGAQPGAVVVETTPAPAATSEAPTAAPVIEPQAESDQTLLLWEGPALFAEDQSECHRLQLTAANQALLGPCAGEQREVEFNPSGEGALADMIARFAPFQAETAEGRLTFNGQGQIGGPAWERALTVWASVTYAELATGHVAAASRTVLAWRVAEQEEQCQMLLVLAHGYATRSLVPAAKCSCWARAGLNPPPGSSLMPGCIIGPPSTKVTIT
jgi:hypothetical protein